jgi:hypothetical protein
MDDTPISRRRVLRAGGLVLAGIGGRASADRRAEEDSTARTAATATAAPAEARTEAETEPGSTTAQRGRAGPPWEVIPSYATAMLTSPIQGPMTVTYCRGGRRVYRTTADSELTQVATLPDGFRPDLVCRNATGQWLAVTGTWSDSGTAHLYRSRAAMEAGRPAATLDGGFLPLRTAVVPFWDWWGGDGGFVWPEYHLASPQSIRILRASTADGFSIEPTLSVPTTSGRGYHHFHSIDHDPYNPGTIYATTGDPNPRPQWYRSTDYGRTWSRVPGAGGSQHFRTLRINFGPEYLYWAMDGWDVETGKGYFHRAPRRDPSAFEEIATIGTEAKRVLSYGSARTFDPEGVLVTVRTDEQRRVPLYFYDIETERFDQVYTFEVDYDLDSVPGVNATMPYQDRRTGRVPMYIYGVPNPRDDGRFWAGFDVQRVV